MVWYGDGVLIFIIKLSDTTDNSYRTWFKTYSLQGTSLKKNINLYVYALSLFDLSSLTSWWL